MAAPVKAKRPRGRPRKAKPETPPVSAYGASPAQTDEMIEDLAGNGRDETAHDPEERPFPTVEELRLTPEEVARFTARQAARAPAPGPQLTKLFVAAVENGYVVRPAYSDGYKGATDNRSWVVTSKEELARMVSWLVADRGRLADLLGGPYHMPQPTDPHYAAPIGLQADETVG